MRKAAISLGLALALGVFQNYGLGQTPARNSDTSASAVSGNPPNTPPDKPAQDQDRKWHVKLGPVLVGAGYSRFSGPFYYYCVISVEPHKKDNWKVVGEEP